MGLVGIFVLVHPIANVNIYGVKRAVLLVNYTFVYRNTYLHLEVEDCPELSTIVFKYY
jgi:hypothetical protein